MFTPKLTAAELVSIVVASPPGSALRHAFDGGFTTTDHLLATLSEQQAGLVQLQGRHERPGIAAPPTRGHTHMGGAIFETMSIEDFEKRRRARYGNT